MMKNILFIAVILLVAIIGCNTDEIPTYNDLNSQSYIYFAKKTVDSVEYSFLQYPNQTEIRVPLALKISGSSKQNGVYKLIVLESYTTATDNLYEIPVDPVFEEYAYEDTCYITLKYNSILDDKKFRLAIQIEDSDDFLAGKEDNIVAIIWFHNILSQPEWWNANVIQYYLGTYSDKKYKTYLQEVGVDLTDANESELRHFALVFKNYLQEQKSLGNPVLEDDGYEMEVPVLGNLVN